MNEETRKLRDEASIAFLAERPSYYGPECGQSFLSGADWGYAQAKREAQGEIELLKLAYEKQVATTVRLVDEERARGEKLREALKRESEGAFVAYETGFDTHEEYFADLMSRLEGGSK